MRTAFFILITWLSLISCKKNTLDIESFWQCNSSQSLDSTAISNKLAGSWIWKKQSCSWGDKTIKADKNVKVTFNSNASFSVSENSVIVTQGNWKLILVDSNLWGLELTSRSEYLLGRIFFAKTMFCSIIVT